MREHQKIITMLLNALGDHVEHYEIILERKDKIIQEPVYENNVPTKMVDKKIGTITISVSIDNFINIYKDILEDSSIIDINLLTSMKNHKFYDSMFNEIDKGYVEYIEAWIDEGITLTEV